MPRLDPAEALRRKKERSRRQFERMRSGEAYAQYDPGDGAGFGSEAQWRAAAGGGFTLGDETKPIRIDANLRTLGLSAMPDNRPALKRAFRAASFKVHPDYGGSDVAFIALKQAYTRIYEKLSA